MLLRTVDVAIARIASADAPRHGELECQNGGQQMALDRCRVGLVKRGNGVAGQCRAGDGRIKALDIVEENVNRELRWAGVFAADNLGQRDQRGG